MNKLEVLKRRLEKMGIKIEFQGNIPWIYLSTINGKRVKETYQSNYGFTIAYYNNGIQFTDLKEIFNLIRKYNGSNGR